MHHSTASIYFSNGSTFNIAKIEGGSAYKHIMRASDSIRVYDGIPQQSRLDKSSKAYLVVAQIRLGLQSLRDYLPPWLGGQDSRTEALSRMLKALKVATESFLEAPVSDVEVVAPFEASETYLAALRAACSSLSLRMPRWTHPPAGIYAARANGIEGRCEWDPQNGRPIWIDEEQLVLTVDYSRAALTVVLWSEFCTIYENRRFLHEPKLGTDALFLNTSHTTGPDTARAQLAEALREITRLPLATGNGAGLTVISQLVMMGESADDPRLHDALVQVLRDEHSHGDSVKVLGKGAFYAGGKVDPVFAASQGLAEDCLGRLEYVPPFGEI